MNPCSHVAKMPLRSLPLVWISFDAHHSIELAGVTENPFRSCVLGTNGK
jgi:hypothetical protein